VVDDFHRLHRPTKYKINDNTTLSSKEVANGK